MSLNLVVSNKRLVGSSLGKIRVLQWEGCLHPSVSSFSSIIKAYFSSLIIITPEKASSCLRLLVGHYYNICVILCDLPIIINIGQGVLDGALVWGTHTIRGRRLNSSTCVLSKRVL